MSDDTRYTIHDVMVGRAQNNDAPSPVCVAVQMCAVMDIPVYDNLIESLHVLFTTFMEFKSNAHFMQLGAASGGAKGSVDFGYK